MSDSGVIIGLVIVSGFLIPFMVWACRTVLKAREMRREAKRIERLINRAVVELGWKREGTE